MNIKTFSVPDTFIAMKENQYEEDLLMNTDQKQKKKENPEDQENQENKEKDTKPGKGE